MSPLHYAVLAKNLEITKYLVEHFAELNCMNLKGRTPLHLACNLGSL
jgi:ankyrin repeat protein